MNRDFVIGRVLSLGYEGSFFVETANTALRWLDRVMFFAGKNKDAELAQKTRDAISRIRAAARHQ